MPQIVLDLGFAEWVIEREAAGEVMPFPEIARRTGTRPLADAFLKYRRQIWEHLKITYWDEDGYALRRTLQSMLEHNDVSEGRRQALAGHKNGKIVNRHYTAFRIRSLKADIDRAPYRIVVEAERLAAENFRRPMRGRRAELADELCARAAVRMGAIHAGSRGLAIAAQIDHDSNTLQGLSVDSRQTGRLGDGQPSPSTALPPCRRSP